MNTNSFSVGQKVICINDAFHPRLADWYDYFPVAGYIYTIRRIQIGRDRITGLSNVGFLLDELLNPTTPRGEPGFLKERFVPWLETCSETKHNDEVEPLQLQEAH